MADGQNISQRSSRQRCRTSRLEAKDSLLRKIDFRYDHFAATYGPKGDGLNKALVPAPYAPSISRRIEQIVTPVTPFSDTAIKAPQHFMDLAPLLEIDSYDLTQRPIRLRC